ncbi:MAG: hypothetical protein DMG57_43230 [Acidobacteria bacterium]|nr:MAG: hypothetical protein DMG57_43230 [Acidobacteriota bacterium]
MSAAIAAWADRYPGKPNRRAFPWTSQGDADSADALKRTARACSENRAPEFLFQSGPGRVNELSFCKLACYTTIFRRTIFRRTQFFLKLKKPRHIYPLLTFYFRNEANLSPGTTCIRPLRIPAGPIAGYRQEELESRNNA